MRKGTPIQVHNGCGRLQKKRSTVLETVLKHSFAPVKARISMRCCVRQQVICVNPTGSSVVSRVFRFSTRLMKVPNQQVSSHDRFALLTMPLRALTDVFEGAKAKNLSWFWYEHKAGHHVRIRSFP
jgi:hypothetical protein